MKHNYQGRLWTLPYSRSFEFWPDGDKSKACLGDRIDHGISYDDLAPMKGQLCHVAFDRPIPDELAVLIEVKERTK